MMGVLGDYYKPGGDDVRVSDGGTGASTLTDHGVLVGSGTDPITALAVGTDGQILMGNTGADPSFQAQSALDHDNLSGIDAAAAGVTHGHITAAAQTIAGDKTFSGIVALSAGSASAPALIPTGDANTGLFFPAADTVAIAIAGAEALRVDANKNLGVGVTPSAWNSSIKAIQIGGNGWMSVYGDGGYYGGAGISKNAYWDSASGTSWTYTNTQPALRYEMGGSAGTDTHAWYTAPSGTAGNAITFTQAMTLDAGGNLILGNTSATTSTILDLVSTSKAFCPPRMTETQRDAISSPSAGMVIYNTTTNVLNFHNGSAWGAV